MLALVACGIIGLTTALFAPIADTPWPRVAAFVPSYQTTIILAYLITAYLIFTQYRVTRKTALLYLAGGCLFTGAILLVQFLTFPGMFVANGPLLGGPQSTIWLWCLWHIAPALGILLYTFARRPAPQHELARGPQVEFRFGIGLAAVFALCIAAVTTFNGWLPVLDVEGNYHRITTTGIAPAIQLLTASALAALWWKTGMRTVLQIWLGVALFALLCDNAITMLGGARLSVGWYVGRFNALISAVTILLVYLGEINRAYLASALDAHKMAASCVQLEAKVQEAQVDFLTGLPGRALFLEQAQALCVRAAAAGMANAILFIDLDGFKETNDRFGHDFGDNVLIQTADVLTSSIPREYVAGRVGGDEFVLCLAAPAETVALFAEQVANHIVRKISCFGSDIGCSIGVAVNTEGVTDLEAAIKKADDAMYAAKKRGKNRFIFHDRPRLVAVS